MVQRQQGGRAVVRPILDQRSQGSEDPCECNHPGPIETPIFGKMGLTKEEFDQFGKYVVSQMPMGRIDSADEVATVVVFLASDESSYITGVDLSVDGGLAQA